MGIGKVSQEDMLIDYNELEDYEGKELTIIARLESRKYYRDKPLPVFDIYKDFLGLNRALRKQIASEKKQEFEKKKKKIKKMKKTSCISVKSVI